MLEAVIALTAHCCYVAAAALVARTLRQHRRDMPASLLGLAGALLHALLLQQLLVTPQGIDLGLFHALALIALVVVLALEFVRLRSPVDNLFVFVYPLAALSLPLAVLIEPDGVRPVHLDGALVTHVVLSLTAYALVTLAFAQAVLMMMQERWLRSRSGFSNLGILPPLQTMEQVLFQLVGMALAVMTGALFSGFLTLEDLFAQRVVHHTFLSIASWVIFAALLAGRWLWGWRGDFAARWIFAGFLVLGLAYFGSKTVIEVILPGG